MSSNWDRPDMRFRVTVPNKEVNAVADRVKARLSNSTVRIGPSFYCDDDATVMLLVILADGQRIEDRPPD